jgi:MFS family permease
MWIGATITGIGGSLTIVAVGLHIYALTASTLAVSLVAAFSILPMIVFGLYGGALADSFDRRKVALVAAIVSWSSTAGIALVAWLEVTDVWPLYVLVTLNAVGSTMVNVARQAIIPRLIRTELLPAAGALGGLAGGIMFTVGPAIAGVLVAFIGFQWTYTIDVVLYLAAFYGLYTLPATLPEGERKRAGFRTVVDGIRFLKEAPNIRASFVLDIFAMTFGYPRALLPAVGALLIGGGAITVGILTSAIAVGGLLLSVFSGRVGSIRAQGKAIAFGVAGYGASILLFGVVLLVTTLLPHEVGPDIADANLPALLLASVLLAISGATDSISMIFRNTMLQAAVPDQLRGRLQGIFTVVVTGGPRVGDLYVGVLSLTALLWMPPLLGGFVIVVAAAVVLRITRSLREYDSLDPKP